MRRCVFPCASKSTLLSTFYYLLKYLLLTVQMQSFVQCRVTHIVCHQSEEMELCLQKSYNIVSSVLRLSFLMKR